jgi:protein phosphatase 1 regulatory subunit 11
MQKNKFKEQVYYEDEKEDEKEVEKEEFVLKKKPDTHYLAMKLPKKVTWSEDTVDNEHMHKKKSNICCIYHRPKLSPDDPDTSSCDSCDEKGKNAYERPNHYNREHHDHHHGNGGATKA